MNLSLKEKQKQILNTSTWIEMRFINTSVRLSDEN